MKHIKKGREQYNNELKNDAIYSSSEYILSEIADQKRQPTLVAESSNLCSELPKVDLVKIIDTDASISQSPSISFAIESPSECFSPTMQVKSPDIPDSTSKEEPSYSPDTVEILKSRKLPEDFSLPDIIETYLVEFCTFLEEDEFVLSKSITALKSIIALK